MNEKRAQEIGAKHSGHRISRSHMVWTPWEIVAIREIVAAEVEEATDQLAERLVQALEKAPRSEVWDESEGFEPTAVYDLIKRECLAAHERAKT